MLTRVTTGERFRPQAADWNELVTGALAGRDSRGAGGEGIAERQAISATLLVRNGAASVIPRNGVLSLAAPSSPLTAGSDSFLDTPILTGGIPAVAGEPFAIVLEPLTANGGIGLAAVAGVVPVQVDVSDAAHAFATTQASAAALASSATRGVPILWKESGTGRKWAQVLLGNGGAGVAAGYLAKIPTGGIAARSGTTVSSASCAIYRQVAGVLTSQGFSRTVFNPVPLALEETMYVPILPDAFGDYWAAGVGQNVVECGEE